MVNNFDKKLYEILEKKYEESLKNFVSKFGNSKHITADEIAGKIVSIKKKKKLSVANYRELSSLMSNFLFQIKD